MKKYTSINSADDIAGELHPALAQIETVAYNAGYDLIGNGYQLTALEPRDSGESAPRVDIVTRKYTTGVHGEWYAYNCTVKFPTLRASVLPYPDSIESRIKSWLPLARVITMIQAKEVYPMMYEED